MYALKMSRRSRRRVQASKAEPPAVPPVPPPQNFTQAVIDVISTFRPTLRNAIFMFMALLIAAAAIFAILPERAKEAVVQAVVTSFRPSPAVPIPGRKAQTTAPPQQEPPANFNNTIARPAPALSTIADAVALPTAASTETNRDTVTSKAGTTISLHVLECPTKAGGELSGKVTGLPDHNSYGIVVYAHTDKWYVQPGTGDRAIARIQEDGTWRSWSRAGEDYLVLLVTREYETQATAEEPPITGDDVVMFDIVKAAKKGSSL